MKKFLEVAKKIKGDYLVSSYFISNMFYSTVSPTIQVAYMQGMSSKMLSLMMIISCLTGTIIPVLWDNNKEKLYNKFGILCRLETIFYTAVLLAILLSLITPKGWYILDSLYGAFVTTNLRIAAKIMQAKRYDTEEKRIDFDMISGISSNLSCLIGFTLNLFIDITIKQAFTVLIIGIVFDNAFAIRAWKETRKKTLKKNEEVA